MWLDLHNSGCYNQDKVIIAGFLNRFKFGFLHSTISSDYVISCINNINTDRSLKNRKIDNNLFLIDVYVKIKFLIWGINKIKEENVYFYLNKVSNALNQLD